MTLDGAMTLALAAAEEADAPSAWIAIPIVGFVLLFVLFGWVIWRSVTPALWAEPCLYCGKQGSHRRDCTNRPRGDGESVGEKVAYVGVVAVLNALFGSDD